MRAFLLFLFIIAITGIAGFQDNSKKTDCEKKGGVYIRQYGSMGICIEGKEIKL